MEKLGTQSGQRIVFVLFGSICGLAPKQLVFHQRERERESCCYFKWKNARSALLLFGVVAFAIVVTANSADLRGSTAY